MSCIGFGTKVCATVLVVKMHYSVEVIKKFVIFVILAKLMSSHRASGFIANISRPINCQGSTATINFDFNLQGGSIVSGSKVWLFNRVPIAEDTGSGFNALNNYTSRLTSHSSDGLTLSSVTTADSGTYEYEILLAAGFIPKTATASFTVYIGPLSPSSSSGCSVNASQSGNIVTCTVSGNCGTPPLNPTWVNFTQNTSNQFACTGKGTYQCCATSAALTSCYSGSSNDFCTLFNCTSGTFDPCPDELRIAVGIGLAIIIIGCIIWIVLFLVKGDQFCLGLGICSVINIIGCIISIVFLALRGYQLSLGLGICFGIIILACIICIIILIFVKNGDYLRLGHCICFVIIIIVCISCIVILAKMGGECPQSFLVGLGIGFGILIIVCIISILILVFYKKVTIQNKDTSPRLRTDEKEVTITAIICGLWISVEWIKEKTILENNGDFTIEPYDNNTRKSSLIIKRPSMTDIATYICQAKNRCGCCSAKDSITFPHDKNKPKTGSSADVSRQDVELQVVETGVKSNNKERPPAVRTGTQNKVDSETPSKQTNDRHKPLQPVDTGVEDTPKIRPQPPPPQNSDTKNQNQRGISANFDDTRGLANETARPNKLPPLKDASEEPKKKRKKKKKGQMNDGNPDEEMVQLKSTRTLPGDQSDGD